MIILATYSLYKQLMNSSVFEHSLYTMLQASHSWIIMSVKLFFCLFVIFPSKLIELTRACTKANGKLSYANFFSQILATAPSPDLPASLHSPVPPGSYFLNIFCTEFMIVIGRKFGFKDILSYFQKLKPIGLFLKQSLYYSLYYQI